MTDSIGGGSGGGQSDEEIRDLVASFLDAGAEISITHDDPNDTLTVDFSGSHYTAEQARDDVGAALTGGTDIDVSVDDANDTITISYSGAVGLLDGEDFDGQGSSDFSNLNSLGTEELTHDTQQQKPQSLWSNLEQGRAVGYKPTEGVYAVNPVNFADDTTACRDVIDTLLSSGENVMEFHLPGLRSDGTEWDFPSTLCLGDDTDADGLAENRAVVIPYFHGFSAERPNQDDNPINIRTSITNGDPVFRWQGAPSSGGAPSGGRIYGHPSFDLRGNDAGAIEIVKQKNFTAEIGVIQDFLGDGVVVGDECFEWQVEILSCRPQDGQGTKTARGFVMDDVLGTGSNPGDGAVYIDTESEHAESVALVEGGNLKVGGKLEDARGAALIDHQTNLLTCLPTLSLSKTQNGAHGIDVGPGGVLDATSGPNRIEGPDGDGINAVGATFVNIEPIGQLSGTFGGASINIDDIPGRVPYESALEKSPSYPSSTWDNLKYNDGWAKWREGTQTISAGATEQIEAFAQSAGAELKVELGTNADPNGDAAVSVARGWDDGNNQQGVWVTEELGNTGIEITFTIYRKT